MWLYYYHENRTIETAAFARLSNTGRNVGICRTAENGAHLEAILSYLSDRREIRRSEETRTWLLIDAHGR